MAGRPTAGVRSMAQTKRNREPLSEAGNQSLQSNKEGIFQHNVLKFCQLLNHTCRILKCHKLNMEKEYALQVVVSILYIILKVNAITILNLFLNLI